MGQLLIFCSFLFIGYAVGHFNERRHFNSLIKRERATRSIQLNNCKKIHFSSESVIEQKLVVGSTVVSIDYYKLIVAGLKSFFGGELKSIESLIERGRREAILRMKEQSPDFSMVTNIKVETSSISKSIAKNHVGSVEIIAYGTAVKLK